MNGDTEYFVQFLLFDVAASADGLGLHQSPQRVAFERRPCYADYHVPVPAVKTGIPYCARKNWSWYTDDRIE